MRGMGSHQSAAMLDDEWLTPPNIINALGPFDLDPCSAALMPWMTATRMISKKDDGLKQEWTGRVWCNPPYGLTSKLWLKKLYEHGNGVALIFARTETKMFFEYVWEKADAVLFLRGRLHFHYVDGERADANAGAPSALVAYGKNNVKAIQNCGIVGQLIILKP